MTANVVPLFINPVAGRGRAARKLRRIVEIFDARGVTLDVVESTRMGDVEERIADAAREGVERIVVAGGDGSVYETANGLLKAGGKTAFGLIPVGTGNDFAKAADIPLDWEAAAAALAGRLATGQPPRPIDAGIMNDRYFANGVGIGFDAKINRIASKYRWPIGDFVYLVAVLEGLWDGVITPSVRMRFDSQTYEGSVTLANISNGPWVGGMFHIAPGARNDDGYFDLVYADPVGRGRALTLLPKVIRGQHTGEAEIHTARIRQFNLVAEEPLPSHLDGEAQPLQTDFEIRLLESALRLL